MADAKSLRMDAARKALAERGGQSVYPRTVTKYSAEGNLTADLQDGLKPTLSSVRPTSKATERLDKEYDETRDLEDFQDLLNDFYDGKFDKYRKEISDRKYAGLGSRNNFTNRSYRSDMEEEDLELSRLVDRGSFGDVRPEMAEIAKQDADFIRQTEKSVRDLTDLANDSKTEKQKRQLRDRVRDSLLGR